MSTEMQLRDVEGVQFFTDNDGNAGLSQRGLAKLCGIHAGNAKRDIESIISKVTSIKNEGKIVESYTVKGDETDASYTKVYNSDLCVDVIAYSAMELRKPEAKLAYNKFAKIGFTKWVQTITGFEPSQPVAVAVELTALQVAKAYVALLEEKAEVIAYLGDKPGLAHKMAQAHSAFIALPAELLSFDEMCDLRGIARYPKGIKQELSRKLANSVANDNLVKVGTKTITKPREGNKKPQYYTVNAYSVESLPHFDNVIKLYGHMVYPLSALATLRTLVS